MTELDAAEKKNSFSIFHFLFGIGLAFLIYKAAGVGMYNYELAKFNGISFKEWSMERHFVLDNGSGYRLPRYGSMASILQLKAVPPESGMGTVQEWCPGITSKRGFVTMGFIDDEAVCCNVGSDRVSFFVPFKDVGDRRHFFCGSWPMIDEVSQPLSQIQK